MSDWGKFKLGDTLNKIVGGGTPSKSIPEYWNGDIFWCSVKDMADDKFSISSTEDKISSLGLAKSASNLIKAGTVITATRMGLGRAFINNIDMAINQDLKALYPNEKIDNRFLLWTIINKRVEIDSLGTGATVKGITLETLKSIEINLPPLPTQKRIASILSAYDDLIENNLKRIKLLEEIAQRTYEEWFVKFRVNGEQLPIDEATGLPVGWERKKISAICEKITDGTHDSPKQTDSGFKLITGKHLLNGGIDFESAYNISEEDHIKITKRSGLKINDILFSNIGTLGNVAIINDEPNYSCKNMIIFRPSFGMQFYLYSYLTNKNNKERFLGQSSGSTQKFISLNYIRSFEDNMPDNNLILKFNDVVKSFYSTICNLQKQNEKLKQSCDILLPRLMSGTINVV
jgi:type I restriction enzyme S subunit